MATLRIEHAISDFAVWRSAFDRFADARARGGVQGVTIRQPVDDPHYVMLDLEFSSASAAEEFASLLRTRVWSEKDASPALVGTPTTRILDVMPG